MDDILAVMKEEANEDHSKLAGLENVARHGEPIFKTAKQRL